MKVNLQKLTELELKYKESMLATDTIQKMLSVIFDNMYGINGIIDKITEPNYLISFTTLQELGIIEN